MNILITGGTGFIGRQLIKKLLDRKYHISVLSRNRQRAFSILGSNCNIIENLSELQSRYLPDTVINLSGEPIVEKRWSKKRKKLLRDSRILFTKDLVDWLIENAPSLKVMISGSALGYYGSQPANVHLSEDASATNGFTYQLCEDWEIQAKRLESINCRVCLLRTGLVLGKNGGALAKMLPAFRLGLGGPIDSGQQMMSWVHIDDEVNAIIFLMDNPAQQGPYNITAPRAVTNQEFSSTLAQLLHRPGFFRMPGFIIKLLLGEGAELLLQGQNVIPERLLQAGFSFQYTELKEALSDILEP